MTSKKKKPLQDTSKIIESINQKDTWHLDCLLFFFYEFTV